MSDSCEHTLKRGKRGHCWPCLATAERDARRQMEATVESRIAAAVAAEREACAELVDAAVMAAYERGVMADPERSRFVRVAAAIRARGQS